MDSCVRQCLLWHRQLHPARRLPAPAAAALLVLPNGMAGMTYTREVEIVKCP